MTIKSERDSGSLDNYLLRFYYSSVEARCSAPASIAVSAAAVRAPGGTLWCPPYLFLPCITGSRIGR